MEPDIPALAAEFPEWHIGSTWWAATSGPDMRCLVARRGPVVKTAFTAAGLRRQILSEGG